MYPGQLLLQLVSAQTCKSQYFIAHWRREPSSFLGLKLGKAVMPQGWEVASGDKTPLLGVLQVTLAQAQFFGLSHFVCKVRSSTGSAPGCGRAL